MRLNSQAVRQARIDDDGSVILLVAIFLGLVLAIAAMVVDVGYAYLTRSRLIDAADSSALAGALELPGSPLRASAVASEYAHANYSGLDGFSVTVGPDHRSVSVVASDRIRTFIAGLFGRRFVDVSAASTAAIGNAYRTRGVRPFGVVEQEFAFGEEYVLKLGSGRVDGVSARNGNFGALALGGRGAANYESNIRYGSTGAIEVGQRLWTEPGNMSGPTQKGVAALIDACRHTPRCTFDTVKKDCPRLVVAPVIDSLDVNGRSQVTVVGFAVFFIENYVGNGNDSYVIGRFVERVIDAEPGNAAYYGAKTVRLTQ